MDVRQYYEHYWAQNGIGRGIDARISPAVEQLLCRNVRPGDRVLDVGCGDGRKAGLWLRDYGARYNGVDVSAGAVAAARSLGLDALLMADDGRLPFRTASFDAATCFEVFEHLFDPSILAGEIHRVLKAGGTLIGTVPNALYWRRRLEVAVGRFDPPPQADGFWRREPWHAPHLRFFGAVTLIQMLRQAGFARVRIGGEMGMLFGDLPGANRVGPFRRRRPSRVYTRLEGIFPGLLAYRLDFAATR
jgi:SAM-dependent methyltransferase